MIIPESLAGNAGTGIVEIMHSKIRNRCQRLADGVPEVAELFNYICCSALYITEAVEHI